MLERQIASLVEDEIMIQISNDAAWLWVAEDISIKLVRLQVYLENGPC
jgi:hypothetical protein